MATRILNMKKHKAWRFVLLRKQPHCSLSMPGYHPRDSRGQHCLGARHTFARGPQEAPLQSQGDANPSSAGNRAPGDCPSHIHISVHFNPKHNSVLTVSPACLTQHRLQGLPSPPALPGPGHGHCPCPGVTTGTVQE